jgi:hypothetical protein
VKLREKGSSKNTDLDNSDVVAKVEKLAEKAREADKELDYVDSVSLVLSENPKLRKEYEQG